MKIDTSPEAVQEDWAWRIPRYWSLLAKQYGVAIAKQQYANETNREWPRLWPQTDADVGPFLANYPTHPQAWRLASGER